MSDRLVNLRDLGGLGVVGGGQTRRGVLYRSDAPHEGDVTPDHVPLWPPATVVDLRMEREAARAPYTFPQATRVLYPLHESAAPENLRQADLGALYRHLLDTVPDRIAGAVGVVVSQPGPALVHCTAGKDRTGIVVAVLLLAAGVTPDDVVADYLRTGANMDAVLKRIALSFEAPAERIDPAWLTTPAAAMTEVVEALTALAHGDVRGWLAANGTPPDALDEWVSQFVDLG